MRIVHRIPTVVILAVLAIGCGNEPPPKPKAAPSLPPPTAPLAALPFRLRMQTQLELSPIGDSSACVIGTLTRLEPIALTDSLRIAFVGATTEAFFPPGTLLGQDRGWVYGIWRLDAEKSGGQWMPSDTGPRIVAFAANVSADSTLNLHALVTTRRGKGLRLEDRWHWAANPGSYTCLPPVSPGDIMAALNTPLRNRAVGTRR